MQRKCDMCGEYYEVPEYKPAQMKTVSKPGAAISVKTGKIPEHFQAQISHNLRCPARPGGIDLWTWFKWKVRSFFLR